MHILLLIFVFLETLVGIYDLAIIVLLFLMIPAEPSQGV